MQLSRRDTKAPVELNLANGRAIEVPNPHSYDSTIHSGYVYYSSRFIVKKKISVFLSLRCIIQKTSFRAPCARHQESG